MFSYNICSNNNQDFYKFFDVKLKCLISHVIDLCRFKKNFFRILSRFYDIFKLNAREHENGVDNEKCIIQKLFPSKCDKNYQTLISCYNNKKNTKIESRFWACYCQNKQPLP